MEARHLGKTRIVCTLFLFLAIFLGACAPKSGTGLGPSPQQTPSPAPSPAPSPQSGGWDAVLAAARQEVSVTLYNTLGADLEAAMRDGIKQYGIKLETVGGTGGELELRISTEQRTKAYAADLLVAGWTNTDNVVKGGFNQSVDVNLPSLADKSVWSIVPNKHDSNNSNFIFGTSPTFSAAINTDLVKVGEIQSWQDLLDPRWKDRIVMTDPRTGSGPGATGLWAWSSILGESYWRKLAAQNVTMQVAYPLTIQQLSLGEKAIAIFPHGPLLVTAIRAGAPLKIISMKEGMDYNVKSAVFVKNAPHRNAALVLLNWMFSKEGQVAMGRALQGYSTRTDITQNWLLPDMNPSTMTFLSQPDNLDSSAGKNGADFGKKVFGTR